MPRRLSIDTSEVQKLSRDFDHAGDVAEREMDRAVDRISQSWLADARSRVPRGPTGAARASLRIVEGSGANQLIGGSRKAPYYPWLDFGGRAGSRGARRPVIRGGRFIYPALVNQKRMITNVLDDAADKIVKAV